MRFIQELEILKQDLRHCARGFRRSPGFTLSAMAALALGVGMSTAVFSVVDRILFRDLPYSKPSRLVSFGMAAPVVSQEFMLAYDYLDWRGWKTPLSSLGARSNDRDCDLSGATPIRLRCVSVDAAFLETLGAPLTLGRNFNPLEDRPNGANAAIVSHALWRSRFAGDPDLLRKQIVLDGKPVSVVGVLPPDFVVPGLPRVDVLVPLALDPIAQATRKIATLLFVIGRLQEGVSIENAPGALRPFFEKSLENVSPEFRKDVQLRVQPLRELQVRDARATAWILLASVLAVLLIACANVANLLLARAAKRSDEFAIRVSLGASRRRLTGQLMTESLVLALLGGLAGAGLASVLLRVFVGIAQNRAPQLGHAGLDARILLFTLAATLICGVLFGLAPVFKIASDTPLARARVGRNHARLRYALIAAQIGVSLILLSSASLLLRSLWKLQNQPLGLRPARVITATLSLGRNSYPTPASYSAFFDALETRLQNLPGVSGFALSDTLPPEPTTNFAFYGAIDVQGRPRSADGAGGRVSTRSVTPGYFAALGIPVLRGRVFTSSDRQPNENPVILSEVLARRMFPGDDALNRQIRPGRVGPWLTVVGVVGNVKNNGLAQGGEPEFYTVRKPAPANVGRTATAVVVSAVDEKSMARAIRNQISALDPALPVDIENMDQRLATLASGQRFNAALLTLFSVMGVILAMIGVYGVVSYAVTLRRLEIGIRSALGATPFAIVSLVLVENLRWIGAGAAVGVLASLGAARILRSMLFQISPNDPFSAALALSVLAGSAAAATLIPTWRAAHSEPARALRRE